MDANRTLALLQDEAQTAAALTALVEVAELVIAADPEVVRALNGAGLPSPSSLALAAEKARNILARFPPAQ